MKFNTVYFDEIHYLSNLSAKRTKAAKFLRADRKIGASATVILNNPMDVYSQLKVVGHDLGNLKTFRDRYIVYDIWGSPKYYKNLDELAKRIQPFLIRKTLEETHFQLPTRTDTDIEFELSAAESSLYNRIRSELLFELEAAEVSKLSSPIILQNTLVKLGKLQELTDSCELIGDSTHSTKLEVLKEHLKNSLIDGQKAIIFTRFSRMAEILGRELSEYLPCVLTGQTINRQNEIDSFITNPKHRIFISTEAGGVGLNLQSANMVYNFDLPFSLGKLEQRLGRIRWHMQNRPVFFYNLIAKLQGGKKTIDSFVKKKLEAKQELSEMVFIKEILTM